MPHGLLQGLEPCLKACLSILQLKQLYRQGWLNRGLPPASCETVAEHSFAVAALALLLLQQRPDLDQARVLKLAILHDLGEVHAGDLTPDDPVSPAEKMQLELQGMQRILEDVPGADELLLLWREQAAGESPEAIFVRELDRLDLALQAKLYAQQQLLDAEEFMAHAEKVISSSPAAGVFDELRALDVSSGQKRAARQPPQAEN